MVAVDCRPPGARGGVTIRLRTSQDGVSWSRWYLAGLEYAAENEGPPRAFVDPVWTGPGRYVQVAAEATAGAHSAAPALHDVRVTAIDTAERDGLRARALGVIRHVAATIASVQLVPPTQAMTTQPAIVTRAQWGANESWRSGSPAVAPVLMAFVHHTASGNDYSRAEAPGIMRAVYYYHARTLGWSDIGYNFLIDRYGTIYEGRYGGMTSGVVGAQTLGFNTGSTGISVIGDFTKATPPPAVLNSLTKLLAWKLDVHHVDPAGRAKILCQYGGKFATGQLVTLPAVAGHRDANFTSCPGARLYARLPALRAAAAARGLPKIYSVDVARRFISPNADGVGDKTSLGFVLSSAGEWRIEVRDADGLLVREFAGTGKLAAADWGGGDDEGRALPDGAYKVVMSAGTAGGRAREAVATVVLDTVRPKLVSAAVAPDPFTPNGDGQTDVTTVTFTPGEAVSSRISVLGDNGKVLRRVNAWSSPVEERTAVRWDGRIGSDGDLTPAIEGRSTLEIALRDPAGNTSSFTRTVTLDRTVGFPSAAPATFSPNGDGVQDAATFGFALSRAANVRVEVRDGAETVRTLFSGEADAGKPSFPWDGSSVAGATVTSGSYKFVVNARSVIATTSVVVPVTVDLTPPRLTVAQRVAVKLGRAAALEYSVRDAFSSKVKVWAVVTDAGGVRVATLACGWVAQGTPQTLSWKASTRGTYTLTFRAADRGGNREAAAPTAQLVVR